MIARRAPGRGGSRGTTRHGAVAVACVFVVSLSCAGAAWSQTDRTAELLKGGQEALAAGRTKEAFDLFTRGYRQAEDRDARQRFLFLRAAARQQQAKAEDRTEPLEEAVRLYREYLGASPESGAALNNLGRALEDLGQFDAAAGFYRKAIGLQDARRLFYMENLARALAKGGDHRGASRVYRDLAREQPLAEAPHALLMKNYLSGGVGDLPGYLWEILASGQPERSCLAALEALTKLQSSLDEARSVELLTIVAVGLSRMNYVPAGFGETEAGRLLRDLSDVSGWGRCAKEILALYGGDVNPEKYGCWRYKSEPAPRGGMAPTEGFRTLARSIGKWYRERGEETKTESPAAWDRGAFERAAGYFRLAMDLNRHDDVDPVAFTELIRLEVSRNNLQAVPDIARTYEQSLFESKGRAYAQNQGETIYRFHKSLGELYAMLGVWGDSRDAKSAIFQLEHARKVSDDLEKKYARPGHEGTAAKLPEEYRFTPEMTDLLARSYEGAGQPLKVLPLRIEQAERYERSGDRAAAKKVLAPVRETRPPQELRLRYDTIMKAVGTAAEPKVPEGVVPRTEAIEPAQPAKRVRDLRVPGYQ